MTNNKKVYASYAWKVEDQNNIVDKLELACDKRGLTLLRDNNEIDYKDSIPEYMNELAAGEAIILVLSEAYFKSAYCMYELCIVHQRKDFHQSIFPIVVAGTRFSKPDERAVYARYWSEEQQKLDKDLKKGELENIDPKSLVELKKYGEYSREIDHWLSILGNMNTLTEGIHVETDFEAILDLIQPCQHKESTNKPKRHRKSDIQFRQKITSNIRKILDQQSNLRAALQETVDENNSELDGLVELLCNKEFEVAIDDYLYPATKWCLAELDSKSSKYSDNWEAAKTILSWLSLLVVEDEWVETQEKQINVDDLSFTVQVATATGIEVASARFRQLQPKLEVSKDEVVGRESILPSQLNSGWGKNLPVQRILIEIWNKIYPEATRQPLIDQLSQEELDKLDYVLEKCEQRKTHHYYIPIQEEEQNIVTEILKVLPSMTIIYLSSSDTKPTLRVEKEGRFSAIIRGFLTMNNN